MYTLEVYLSQKNMPDITAWKAAITKAGFNVELDCLEMASVFDMFTSNGYVPTRVLGKLSGFEHHVHPISAEELRQIGLEGDFDLVVQFDYGSRPYEIAAAYTAASVLASISSGIFLGPQYGDSCDLLSPEEAIEQAKQIWLLLKI